MNKRLQNAVANMRKWQKEYFRTRAPQAMTNSKRWEREVDKILDEMGQPALFAGGEIELEHGPLFSVKPMSKDECLAELRRICDKHETTCKYDAEEAHIDADAAVLGLILALGYEDVVRLWGSFSKWYA